jgi:hypothetical protein
VLHRLEHRVPVTAMDLDLRIPIGLFFVAVGLIMVVFGLTSDPAIYAKSLGINVNLYWGIAELIFGSLMIAFGRSHHQRLKSAQAASASPAAGAVPVAVKAVTSRYDDVPSPMTTPTPAPTAIPTPTPKPPVPHG